MVVESGPREAPPVTESSGVVLVVEDEAADRTLVERAICSVYELEMVDELAEAQRRLSERPFDAVIADLNLPDARGVQIVERLLETSPETPLIVLTVHDDLAEVCLRAGAQDYLDKSEVDQRTLRRTVGYALLRSRARKLEERLRDSERLATIGQIAASIAHEINNPCAFIAANLEVALNELEALGPGGSGAAVRKLVNDSLTEVARIGSMVRELTSLSRRESASPRDLSVNEIVETTCRRIRNEVRHTATLELDLGALPEIEGDEERLSQIFVNLLVNAMHAIQAVPRTEGRIRVTSRADGETIRVRVSDNGVGVGDGREGDIFRPFFTTKPPGRGAGLGLAISRDIARAHGGDLRLVSTGDNGSVFELVLPLVRTVEGDEGTSGRLPLVAPLRPYRVLLVDDDERLLMVLSLMVQLDHEVVAVGGGEEALEEIAADRRGFDVIICDLMMPGCDGIEVWKRLADAPTGEQVRERMVFLTGGTFTAESEEFARRDDVRVLAKPIRREDLLAAMDQIVAECGPLTTV